MNRILFLCLLFSGQAHAYFNLHITVRDVETEYTIKNVMVDFETTHMKLTDRNGQVSYEGLPEHYLDDAIKLYHPDYSFDVTTITSANYEVINRDIILEIYGHKHIENSFTMDAHIAKSGKIKNDSIFLAMFSGENLETLQLTTKEQVSMTFDKKAHKSYFNGFFHYDDIKDAVLISQKNGSNQTNEQQLSQFDWTQNSIYIGPNLAKTSEEQDINLLKTHFEALKKHDTKLSEMRRQHSKKIWALRDSIDGLHATIHYLKTGKQPIEDIPVPEPVPDPYEIEEPIFIVYETKSAEPEIGMGTALAELEKLLSEQTVKYCGDILLRLTVNRQGKLDIYPVHVPKHCYSLIPIINDYLQSLSWKPNYMAGDLGQKIGLTIKIKKSQ